MRKFAKLFQLLTVALLFTFQFSYSQNYYQGINLDTVKAGKYDMGKMWTFDYPPKDYFASEYNFSPTDEWFNNVRLSALKFDDICSASFVSADGLVMTNHHCGRESVTSVQKQGEDLHKNGFIAYTLADERKVPGLFVEQLIEIIDITKEMQDAIEKGLTDKEKAQIKENKIKELEEKYSQKTGNRAEIVSLYKGGKYSVYIFKRYNDVRLVFAPENELGFFGGDPDNFTYPRYDLDCTFFRVYDESGQPLKTKYFFKWSKNGPVIGEPLFCIGNPGGTNRLKTNSQLFFDRDYYYPYVLKRIGDMMAGLKAQLDADPNNAELEDQYFNLSNGFKSYTGLLKGLNDPILIARKKDFEKTFKKDYQAKPELLSKFGDPWKEIEKIQEEKITLFKSGNVTRKTLGEISQKEGIYFESLGRILFELYGTNIPPDATFTLRISDGVIKTYDYNGTITPPYTTFYGLYDRYYSFKSKDWDLPQRWLQPPPEFHMETPFNFISTNDIIGGNSGSPMINKDAEIVGLIFDGNIESLPGDFIYTTESNRTVSVDSRGLLEAIKNMFKAKRLATELENGGLE
jgi:hypothetical protein